ncbi:hypothetical protein ACFQ7Z_09290 [Streptomyces virginiae]|uniref:hypothetical protein n=1 Tax=Streptomyces virginiae TaxID=1961 RepID=UPI00368741EC
MLPPSDSPAAERHPHPTDRRAKHADSPLSGLTPEEQHVLHGLLERAVTSG